ncbi:MAG: DEAD/DEAH box helicase family protein [Planctomycetaceae bacterium]|nr:DEAD/DEAH box helicase family protein [Planctomycetaceae bacterium]
MNEADTCREYVVPRLVEASWDNAPHSIAEQRAFTDGRVYLVRGKPKRGKQKKADYLLRYSRDFPIAVVEAKADYKQPGDGLAQAKDYAHTLGIKFAYSTNGKGIIEFDFLTGTETVLSQFPSPQELWQRLNHAANLTENQREQLLEGFNLQSGKIPRYYQEIAINRVVAATIANTPRILLTMATGTGKTVVAFQICWKLWSAKWNRKAEPNRRPKILYLADRNILVDDPKDKTFPPFGDARHKIENGEIVMSRDMYFAIYQAIAEDERRPGLYKEFPPDFFDLIIVDECHRGSARADSSWREILEYFKPAIQLGMTATPLREDNRDSYEYFGNPVYTYSLRQGIEDGFLSPYRVHRIVTSADATGWRPTKGEVDRFGREIPDDEYQTKDFERVVALRARTKAIAKHLFDFMQKTDPMGKTLVFCVDQEHALEMRKELQALLSSRDPERAKKYPNYVCRVTADEGSIGLGHLSRFQELETEEPVILTSSQLLTTGVDAKMVKNVALARVVGSMSEFKQIIGRGTRIEPDYGKLWFSILDYTGTATRHFADPDFDGFPEITTEETIDDGGNVVDEEIIDDGQPTGPEDQPPEVIDEGDGPVIIDPPEPGQPRKFYVDRDVSVSISHEMTQDLDASGKLLTVTEFIDYTAGRVRTLCRDPDDLLDRWQDERRREEIVSELESRGVTVEELAEATGHPEADAFDLLCHLAFNAPLRTRKERAERLRTNKQDFFDKYGIEARGILLDLLARYEAFGLTQLSIPDALKLPPISERGNVGEIIGFFGGPEQLKHAVAELQSLIYSAA